MISKKDYFVWVYKVSKEIIDMRILNKCFIFKKNKIIDCFGKECNMICYVFGLYINICSW